MLYLDKMEKDLETCIWKETIDVDSKAFVPDKMCYICAGFNQNCFYYVTKNGGYSQLFSENLDENQPKSDGFATS